ncbi:MAG: hypothetical protein O3A93_01580 [Chloroflexi bacterium]|nr:hypothetical protein [Chloroflexota bacterium]MDA1269938.1 hypothetical protein [Chloroflexota bacterium]PKB59530.1 MAG: hypothetical protein BZY83_01775 [SAR202 cluster bacterium Casp-Chloro-G2]
MTTTLPNINREPATENRVTQIRDVPDYLLEELEQIVEQGEAEPELVHWYHFVPNAGVRYYSYHTTPSPVEPLVKRKR